MSRRLAERLAAATLFFLVGLYALFLALTQSSLLAGIDGTPLGIALSVALFLITVTFGILLILPLRD